MIRVGQFRTDPGDGEIIKILSVDPLEFEMVNGEHQGRRFGNGFSVEEVLRYWRQPDETTIVMDIINHYK